MMHVYRLLVTLVLLALAPALMAPACVGDGTGSTVAAPEMLICDADGLPRGIGVPGAAWSLWQCVVDYKKFDACDCWSEEGPIELATPINVNATAVYCIEVAAAYQEGFVLNETGIAAGSCIFLGYYQPPQSGTPNAHHDDNGA